jgi:protein TonB
MQIGLALTLYITCAFMEYRT